MKIIKTNLSIPNPNNIIVDHQSYIEDEISWEAFVVKVKSGFVFSRHKEVKVKNIKYDDFHLSCDIINPDKSHTKHLAYIKDYNHS